MLRSSGHPYADRGFLWIWERVMGNIDGDEASALLFSAMTATRPPFRAPSKEPITGIADSAEGTFHHPVCPLGLTWPGNQPALDILSPGTFLQLR